MAYLQSTIITGSQNVLNVAGSGSVSNTSLSSVNGNNGRLFEVTDDLSNSLFSVNTIAGLPVIEAFADNTVKLGKYNAGSGVLNISGSSVELSGTIKTAAPTGYTAQPWKLGDAYSGTISTNHYILVEINGSIYSIPALPGTP